MLIIEDEQALREVYALILESNGYNVDTAVDGLAALSVLEEVAPDLILLDMLMPNLDGVGFLQQSNIKNRMPRVKILLFSNVSTPEKITQAMDNGATKHIVKSSLTPKQLLAEVASTLALK